MGDDVGSVIQYDETGDFIGKGRFGFVFKCTLLETGEHYAVKQIPRLRFEAEGGMKEIDALQHAQATDEGGHRNVIRYAGRRLANAHFVYIVMELSDETLQQRIERKGIESPEARHSACRQLCEGLRYLHTLPTGSITHRDLKPSNLLWKGDVLKIADMGQSRILAMGETAVPTGSQGGTLGWMSPEEIAWDNGGSVGGTPFRAHLSGDIHSAGSILFYILTGGQHCFGSIGYKQQANISDGKPSFNALADAVAVDLVSRMVHRRKEERLKIREVLAHPFFLTPTEKLDRIDALHESRPEEWAALTDRSRPAEDWRKPLSELVALAGGSYGRSLQEAARLLRNLRAHFFEKDVAERERVFGEAAGTAGRRDEVLVAAVGARLPALFLQLL